MDKKLRIGWIGLGKMGVPMCRRLAAAGFAVIAHVRHEAGRAKAAELGLAQAASVSELVGQCDVVFSAISDDRALGDVAGALAAVLRAGQAYADTSTVSPEASSAAGAVLAAKGIAYLRAPVSGSTATAEAGQLTIMASGPRETFDALEPVFAAFARKQFYLGAGDEARYMKLAVNAMVAAMSALVAEAAAFGRKGGLTTAAIMEVLCNSAVASPVLDYKRKMLVSEDFTAAFTVEQMMKDLDLLLATGRAVHAPLPLSAQIRQQYEAAYLSGAGGKDYFVLAQQYAKLAGV